MIESQALSWQLLSLARKVYEETCVKHTCVKVGEYLWYILSKDVNATYFTVKDRSGLCATWFDIDGLRVECDPNLPKTGIVFR